MMNTTLAIPIISTITKTSTFTGQVADVWDEWALIHVTTFTGAEADPVPTDHGGLFKDGESHRIVITDGLGHHEPKAIGAVAAEVLDEVSKLSIAQQIERARIESGSELSEKNAYQYYIKGLARAYKNREGTTLLQVEVSRIGLKNIQLTIGKCGDSDVIVIDQKGNVRYATIDTKHDRKTDGDEIGLLAIGSNFSEKWLDNATYINTEIKVKEAFLIACSDGLTQCLRNIDGSIDGERFRHAALTGGSLFADEAIPTVPPLRLSPAIIAENLKCAARGFAQRMQERKQLELRAKDLDPAHLEAELTRVHAGDDTTIIALAIPAVTQSQAQCSTSSATDCDIEGEYYRNFEDAFEREDHEAQLFYLEKMAKFAHDSAEFLKAAHLINGALAINRNEERKHSLLRKLENLEILFFESLFSAKPASVERHSIADNRESLISIREQVCLRIAQDEHPEIVQQWLTKQYKNILCKLVQSAIDLIGKKPPTSFAFIGLGSMARDEMCPYSDIEFAILIKKNTPKNADYFRRLSQLLGFLITNLGETKYPMVRPKRQPDGTMREAVSLTPGGFSMDIGGLCPLGKQGIYELIDTPRRLADYQVPQWFVKNDGEIILVNALTQATFIMGDPKLFENYNKHLSKHLDEKKGKSSKAKKENQKIQERQNRAINFLRSNLEGFRPYIEDDRIALRAFDAKQDLYRPIQMAISGLLLYYGLGRHSTLAGIEQLQALGIFSSSGADNLKEALRTALRLRIQAHLFYKREKEILYFGKGQGDLESQGLFLIDNPKIILDAYRVLTALQAEIEKFILKPGTSLNQCNFHDKVLGELNILAEETGLYGAASSSYTRAAALNPDDHLALHRLGQIKLKQGEAQEALTHLNEALRVLKIKSGEKPNRYVADVLNTLGSTHLSLGETEKAIDFYKESLAMKRRGFGSRPHLSIATTLDNLGFAYKALGETKESIGFYEETLAMKRSIHGDEPHQDIIDALDNLGHAHRTLGENENAIVRYKESLAMKKQIYGDEPHHDIINALDNLGHAHRALGENENAIVRYKESLAIKKQIYGDISNHSIANTLINIANAYTALKVPKEAITYYEQGLRMRKQIYKDKPHSSISSILWRLGNCLMSLGDTSIASAYYQESLAMDELLCRNGSQSEIANTLMNIGHKYRTIKNPTKAIEYFDKAQKAYEQLYSNQPHLTIAQALNYIGAAYRVNGDAAKSVQFCLQALSMKITLYGDVPHEEIAFTLRSLGKGYRALGDQENANASLRKSYEIYKTLKGENHSETKEALALLQIS